MAGFLSEDGPPTAHVILVRPDGSVEVAADDMWFPNGTVMTPDGATLIVAESTGTRLTAFDVADDGRLSNRRVWAELTDPFLPPDGIGLDDEGGVWVANPIGRECARVDEGGVVTETVEFSQHPFACSLGGPDGMTLFACTAPHLEGGRVRRHHRRVHRGGPGPTPIRRITLSPTLGRWPTSSSATARSSTAPGAPRSAGDVEVTDGVITAVGASLDSSATREIDAEGLLVTPGWVDIHTHFDGQVTWDPIVAPSSWHGVTTIGMGNCGVGFAPASPDRHEWLISLLEGVEDIPGTALAEGLTWDWETFPQYLDSLGGEAAHGRRRRARAALGAAHLRDGGAGRRSPRGADRGRPRPDGIAPAGGARRGSHRLRHLAHRGPQDVGRGADPDPAVGRGRAARAGRRHARVGHGRDPAHQRPLPDPRRRPRRRRARAARRGRAALRPPAQLHDAAGVPLTRPLAVPDGVGRPDGRGGPRREGAGRAASHRRAARTDRDREPVRVVPELGRAGVHADGRAASRRCATPNVAAGSSRSTPRWRRRSPTGCCNRSCAGST